MRSFVVVLMVAAGACGARPSQEGREMPPPEPGAGALASERGAQDSCVVARTPLRLVDGTELYIEPEELLEVGTGLLVAGTPNYTWSLDATGRVAPRTADAHLAARFTLDGVAHVVEKPISGAIGSVRVVSLGGDRWGALFDEVHADSLPGKHHRLGIWYAEHDGAQWTTPERLPEPAEGALDLASDSELVRTGDRLVWVVPARLPLELSTLIHYERVDGVWSHEVVSDEWAEIVTLAHDPVRDELWMAHFSEDPGISGWQQTLRLHRRVGGVWDLVARITEAPSGVKVREPRLTVRGSGLEISWWLLGGADMPAHARLGFGLDREGVTLTLDASVFQMIPVADIGGAPAWVVNHLDPERRSSELRLVRAPLTAPNAAPGARPIASVLNPYPSFFAALRVANEVVLIGPEPSPDPMRPAVRSLILRLSTTCT